MEQYTACDGRARRYASLFRRTIVSDIVQGIIVGGVLAFITFQILTNAYVTKVNGWTTMFGCGEPGNGILLRAACANKFTGPINVPQEAMYWTTSKDGAGQKLTGAHDYILHFPPGDFRRTTRSGRSRWAMRKITLCRIRSIDTASAIAPASRRTPTAPSTFTSRTPLRQAMSPTGCPRQQAISYSGCAHICPVRLFWMASTRCRQSSK